MSGTVLNMTIQQKRNRDTVLLLLEGIPLANEGRQTTNKETDYNE